MRVAIPADIRNVLLRPPEPGAFGEAELEGLPQPVQRYLRTAITPGTPLAAAARLRMKGHIKLGRWLPFEAHQLLAPHHGFLWGGRTAGVMTGFDRYADGRGELNWKLLGLVPVAHGDGADVARSAAGRGAAEAFWVPTTLLPRFGVVWSAEDEHHVTAQTRMDSTQVDLHLALDDAGRVTSSVFQRWGDPGRSGAFGLHPFGIDVTGYATFDGVTIPNAGRAGWFHGTDRWNEGEFFRYEITDLQLVRSA